MLAHEVRLGLRLAEQGGAGGFVGVRETKAPAPSTPCSTGMAAARWNSCWPGAAFGVEVVQAAIAVVSRLHRQGGAPGHQAGQPAPGDDGRWRVLDLGVAVSARVGRRAQPACRHAQLHEPRAVGEAVPPMRAATSMPWAPRCTSGSPATCPTARSSPISAGASAIPPPSRLRPMSPSGWTTCCCASPATCGCASRPPRNWCWRWNAAPRPVAAPLATPLFQRDPTVWGAAGGLRSPERTAAVLAAVPAAVTAQVKRVAAAAGGRW